MSDTHCLLSGAGCLSALGIQVPPAGQAAYDVVLGRYDLKKR